MNYCRDKPPPLPFSLSHEEQRERTASPHTLLDANLPQALHPVSALCFGAGEPVEAKDEVAEEIPVALVYNGIAHAVMLATPTDLEDFALGFSLSEGLIAHPGELLDLETHPTARGLELHLTITQRAFQGFKATRRQLAGRTGCGLCGQESLEHAILPVPTVGQTLRVSPQALHGAITQLPERQTLHRQTGGVHAAAWADAQGLISLVREDVGRHNALDKLLGGLYQQRLERQTGFVILTSRASHELVHKAATAGIELLAAVSAPTGLAIRNAQKAGITLVGWLRPEGFKVYTHPQRLGAP